LIKYFTQGFLSPYEVNNWNCLMGVFEWLDKWRKITKLCILGMKREKFQVLTSSVLYECIFTLGWSNLCIKKGGRVVSFPPFLCLYSCLFLNFYPRGFTASLVVKSCGITMVCLLTLNCLKFFISRLILVIYCVRYELCSLLAIFP